MNTDCLKKILVIGLLLIPVFLQIVWQFTNKGLPIADGGDHFRIAYLIYLAFKEGWGSGINFIFHTGGKPILFSVFVAPFIYLAKFNVLLPIRLSLIIMAMVSSLAYYWLFTVSIRPVISALLTSVIMSMPYIFSMSTQFMPETIWHMWFVLFLAALYRSKNLTDLKLTILAGVFLSLTILARPAESLILILPALGLYFYYLYSATKTLPLFGFLSSVIVASFSVLICSLCSIYQKECLYFIGVAGIILATLVLIFLSVKSRNSSTRPMIEVFVLLPAIFCSTWLLFYAKPLIDWAYDNSFGIGAKTNDQVNASRNILSIGGEVLKTYGAFPLEMLFLLMIAVFAFGNKKSISRQRIFLIFTTAALAVVPMLFVYSFTGTSDMRRIYLGVVFLISAVCFLTFLDLKSPRILVRSCISMLILLLFIQVGSIAAVITQNTNLVTAYVYLMDRVGPLNYSRPMRQEAQDANVIQEIHSLGISNAWIAVFSLGMFTDKVLFQAESLRYVTLGIDRSLEFHTLWAYTKYEPYQDVIDRLKTNGFDYVLLEDLDDPFKDPALKKRMVSHTFFIHEALSLIKKIGANHLPDLELIKKFKIDERFVYLFKITGPYDSAKITATSQLGNYGPEGLFKLREPGWHSGSNPKYPQKLVIDLGKSKSFGVMGFLPQDGNASRAPKTIQIKVSNDGQSWDAVANSSNDCTANTPDGWYNVYLGKQVNARFLEIDIFKNCGEPSLLTLRGFRIE